MFVLIELHSIYASCNISVCVYAYMALLLSHIFFVCLFVYCMEVKLEAAGNLYLLHVVFDIAPI